MKMQASKTALLLTAALAVALLAPSPAWGVAGEWSKNPQSSVRLITPWVTAPRDGELWLGLHFKVSPGWHVYWKNSGDAGFPPAVTFQPAEALGKPELLFPTPHRYELPGDLVAFGYEKEVVYPVRAQVVTSTSRTPPAPADAPEGDALPAGDSLWITAELDYLVCEVDCIPYRYTLTVEQPLGDVPVADPETAPLIESWLDRVPRTVAEVPGVTTGAVLDASQPDQPRLEVRILGARGEAGRTELFLEAHEALDAERPRMRVTADGVVFHVPMKQREAGKALPDRTPVAWTVANLIGKDGKAFNLEAQRDVQVWREAGTPPDPLAQGAGEQAPADRMPRMLLWAFLGGALLSLMPTVLPLLISEVLALRSGEAEGGKVREGAAAAACGIVGGAWAVAALSLAAGRAGWPAGWGAQLQEPIVGATFTVASAVLALNLWGLIEAPLPAPGTPGGTGRHLLAGLFTVPLALVWPVPLLQEPVGFAFGRGPAAVSAVFALIGFGLALPYLLLALAPAAARLLPAPGAWLPRLREGLGFLAAAGVFWLLYTLSRQVSPEGLAWIQLALLTMALLAWLRHREGTRKLSKVVLAVGLALCAAGALWLADRNRLNPRLEESTTTGLPQTAREPNSSQTSGG